MWLLFYVCSSTNLFLTAQHKLPKELLQSSLRPVLLHLADHRRLDIASLHSLARLLELLTHCFNVALGDRVRFLFSCVKALTKEKKNFFSFKNVQLLDHLKRWTDSISVRAPQPVDPTKDGTTIQIKKSNVTTDEFLQQSKSVLQFSRRFTCSHRPQSSSSTSSPSWLCAWKGSPQIFSMRSCFSLSPSYYYLGRCASLSRRHSAHRLQSSTITTHKSLSTISTAVCRCPSSRSSNCKSSPLSSSSSSSNSSSSDNSSLCASLSRFWQCLRRTCFVKRSCAARKI